MKTYINEKITTNQWFARLITNQNWYEQEYQETSNPAVIAMREYLYSTLEWIDGKPNCPFVKFIEGKNWYYYKVWDMLPDDLGLKEILLSLKKTFTELSPLVTENDQKPDHINIIYALNNKDALSKDYLDMIIEVRDQLRQSFLDDWMMVAYMHPYHDTGWVNETSRLNTESIYNSRIPLLIARRMHKPDDVFMNLPEEIKAYEKYFGPYNYIKRINPYIIAFNEELKQNISLESLESLLEPKQMLMNAYSAIWSNFIFYLQKTYAIIQSDDAKRILWENLKEEVWEQDHMQMFKNFVEVAIEGTVVVKDDESVNKLQSFFWWLSESSDMYDKIKALYIMTLLEYAPLHCMDFLQASATALWSTNTEYTDLHNEVDIEHSEQMLIALQAEMIALKPGINLIKNTVKEANEMILDMLKFMFLK